MSAVMHRSTGSGTDARRVADVEQAAWSGSAHVAWRMLLAVIAGAVPERALPGRCARPAAPDSFADLAARLLPSVVNVSTTQVVEGNPGIEMPQLPPGSPFEEFFKEFMERNQPRQQQQQQPRRRATSLGSGFFIDNQGHIVTNNHVIQDADEMTVILHDDTRLEAKVIGRDAEDRHRRPQGRTARQADAGQVRQLGRDPRRRLGACHRQPVRLRRHRDGGHHLGAGPRHQRRSL